MDSLKKPEMILGLSNTMALLGASVYFYRKMNEMREDLDRYSEHLASTVNKVKELQITKQNVKQLASAMQELNNKMGEQRNDLLQLKTLTNYQRGQIEEIQVRSNEMGINFKLTGNNQALNNEKCIWTSKSKKPTD
jgi:uncharacterized protein YoxC